MSLVVAALGAQGSSTVFDARCASDSFPGYAETMRALGADVSVEAVPEDAQ
jgi:5-enolpyruvylshikimate-3-phosphate synthase